MGELASLRAMPACAPLSSIEECHGFNDFEKMREAMVLKAMERNYRCSGICHGTDANGQHVYPPTMFSTSNHQLSCDGMAARHIRNLAIGVSSQVNSEGCMLVTTAIVISVTQLLVFCCTARKRD